jgi:pyruvate/2-oxoglutarate dehydrogenase complex dihydrolipoamide acyltransferase (E2) component
MKSLKALSAVSCLGLASLGFVPSASADTWNKKTIITVNEAIQVPGKVLQPGKYVMKLMDSPSNRHVVQIFNERVDQLQTTVLAIPNYRLQPTGETEFQWWETPAGQPKALRAWFYPGDNFGQEFAYPKNEAMTIAATQTAPVPTTYAQTEADLATAKVGTVDRAGTEMELDRQTYSRADGQQPNEIAQATPPATEQPRVTEPEPTPAPAATPAPTAREEALPRTASTLPMIGLAGLLALGAGIAVRRFV